MSGINSIKQVNSDTTLKEEDVANLTKIISDIKLHPDSFNFHEPVKYKEWGLVDYPQIIKTPMDLSTVLNKLKTSKYKFIIEVLDEIQLIWDNCKTYNAEGSEIFLQAENVEKHADNLIKKYYKSEKSENISLLKIKFLIKIRKQL
jgi:hypothetical protein